MHTDVSAEFVFFLASIAAGVAIAFLYDLLRISRRIIGPGDAIVTFEDILFMAAAAFILFYAAYLKNDGEIRWQSFIGGAIGIGIYIAIVRNRFVNLSTFVLKWLAKIMEKIVRFLLFPLRLVFLAFKKPICVIIWYAGRGFKRIRRYTSRKKCKFSLRAKNIRLMLRKK